MKPARLVGAAVAAAALTACTPAQLAQWQEWYASDPEAAVTYANQPDIQAQLHNSATNERQSSSSIWSVNWDRVARCESGGDWSHPPVRNRHGTFSGGVMWNHRYWSSYGGTEFAPYPYQASKAEQIIVSERLVNDIGFDRGWQCGG
jgi:hypothetical protein